MKFLILNCRGADNDTFKNNMKTMIITYRLEIAIILETKVEIAKMRNFFNRFGLTDKSYSDPRGRTGGIGLVWDATQVNWTYLTSLTKLCKLPSKGWL